MYINNKYHIDSILNMSEEFTNTQYQNLSYNQHVRLRTGMYVGSKDITENNVWILNKEDNKLEKTSIKILNCHV